MAFQAEGRVFASDEVEVTRDARRVARAVGVRGFRAGRSTGGLAHLVDHAAGRALPNSIEAEAAEHFHAVVVEGVALQQRASFMPSL